ncbi:MAG: M28 family peptidase [Acidobacteria bacterium]|nr:M28 family peptidase [Acidobacteriota bacterium]MBI3261659.1 M28 family peptidase [Acidobacteriota bacterium]
MKCAHARQLLRCSALAVAAFAAAAEPWNLLAQAPQPAKGVKYAQISPADMKEWLTYLASDELQGRQVFSEGYGLAASYIADHLRAWGVKPLGDQGTYFETVKLKGYRVTRHSSVTIVANDESKTFKQGDHVSFGFNSGGKQTLTFSGAEFVGYGLPADFQARDVKDKLVIWMPNLAPAPPAGGAGRGGGRGGAAGAAITTHGAKAAIGFVPAPNPSSAEQALAQAQDALQKATEAVQQAQAQLQGRGRGPVPFAGGRGRGALPPADLTTVQRPDAVTPPQFTGDETLFETLFSGAPITFADLKARAEKGESLSPVSLPIKVTITIDNAFEIVAEQLTRNVAGLIEGIDPKLKDTYVLFGAHLDHIGYSPGGGGAPPTSTSCRARGEASQAAVKAAGKVVQNPGRGRGGVAGGRAGGDGRGAAPLPPFDQRDIISNGADDDGSGSTAVLAIAKAFATGPKPKRSVAFVWHTGEEAGLQGSRYMADFPIMPLDKVQAQLNLDMVGRDDCDNIEGDYTNTVFVVGADRISTDLHNLIVETNTTLARPLTLDYELNDAQDPESVYTRSDHFSYAAKGIPIAFFTTGLHADYHKVTDTVDKITFPKMARIAQLVYETGFSIANTDRVLERDKKGPRTGFGSKAEVIKK